MKRSAFILLAILFVGAGSIARAQAVTPTPQKTSKIDPKDSVTLADVQRAADELARTVQVAVKQITEDPKLKVAALRLATQSVNAAQVIVTQQAQTLQSVLEDLAKEVAAATVSIQQTKPKTH
jgi:uncharacterized protein YpmS